MTLVVRATDLAAEPDVVWARVTTPAGINDELRPWMRMTMPRSWRHRSIADVAPGAHVGRCWILLFGVVPFDVDDLTIAELGVRHFVERSRLFSAPSWQHERTVTPRAHGCRIEDRLTFESRALTARIPGGTRLHTAVIRTIFRHRHRRLARSFGAG